MASAEHSKRAARVPKFESFNPNLTTHTHYRLYNLVETLFSHKHACEKHCKIDKITKNVFFSLNPALTKCSAKHSKRAVRGPKWKAQLKPGHKHPLYTLQLGWNTFLIQTCLWKALQCRQNRKKTWFLLKIVLDKHLQLAVGGPKFEIFSSKRITHTLQQP